jgi:hypothetical protein
MPDKLLLQKGSKHYILLNGGDRYHLIQLDKYLTEEKEKKLYMSYPCTDQTLHELGVHFTSVPKQSLIGVYTEGITTGSMIAMRSDGHNTRKYALSDNTTPEILTAMFADVRKLPPPRDNTPDAWRKKGQNPHTLKQMKQLRLAMIISAFPMGLQMLYDGTHNLLWASIFAMIPITCLVLVIVLPTYFTLIEYRHRRNQYGIDLKYLYLITSILLSAHVLRRHYTSLGRFALYSVFAGIIICIILWFLVPEFQKQVGKFAAISCFVVLLCGWGIIGQLNLLLDTTPPDIKTYSVQELEEYHGAKGAITYRCYITLSSGERFLIHVDEEAFNTLLVGDTIHVAHAAGGLGLEYLYYVGEGV